MKYRLRRVYGALRSNATANDMLVKDIIRGLDLGQLTPLKLTAHISDSLRRIFLIENEIAMLDNPRPTDSVSISGLFKTLVNC